MKVTENAVYHETKLSNLTPLPESVIELCPECGEGQLIYKRLNCKECLNCNWSLCGM